jgi:hypothetical protein
MQNNGIKIRKTTTSVFDYLKQGYDLIRGEYWLFFSVIAVGLIISSFAPFGILTGPFMCGIFICYRIKSQGNKFEFGKLFKGFDYFLDALLVTLLQLAASLFIMVPVILLLIGAITGIAVAHEYSNDVILFFLLCFLVAIVLLTICLFTFLTMPFQLAYILIVDFQFKAWDAVKSGFKSTWLNFMKLTGLIWLILVLVGFGMCLCYVGMFFVLPVIFGAIFQFYQESLGSTVTHSVQDAWKFE